MLRKSIICLQFSYYKKVKSLLDVGQLGSALLLTPFNYAQGRVYGLELTLNYRNLGAYLNLVRSTVLGKILFPAIGST